jgi:hypothetical protein
MEEVERNPKKVQESGRREDFDPIFRVCFLASFSVGKPPILPRIDLDAWSTSLFGK